MSKQLQFIRFCSFLGFILWSLIISIYAITSLNLCNCSEELFIFHGDTDQHRSQQQLINYDLPPIVYIKTHKTGSETSANIMHRIADIRQLESMVPMPRYSQVKLGWPAPFPGAGNDNYPPSSIDMITDHLVFNDRMIRFYMKPNPFIWTTIRNPWDQAISAFNYFDAYTTKMNFTWETHLEWIEAQDKVLSKKATRFCNSIALDLGWYDKVPLRMRIHDHDPIKINEFIHELDQALDLVVPLDAFDQGLILLSHMLNISYHEMVYLHQNAGSIEPIVPDEKLRPKLQHVLSVDQAIYSHFFQRFHEKWQEISVQVAEAHAHDSTIELLDERLLKLQELNIELAQSCYQVPSDQRCGAHFRGGSAVYNRFFFTKNLIASKVAAKLSNGK